MRGVWALLGPLALASCAATESAAVVPRASAVQDDAVSAVPS